MAGLQAPPRWRAWDPPRDVSVGYHVSTWGRLALGDQCKLVNSSESGLPPAALGPRRAAHRRQKPEYQERLTACRSPVCIWHTAGLCQTMELPLQQPASTEAATFAPLHACHRFKCITAVCKPTQHTNCRVQTCGFIVHYSSPFRICMLTSKDCISESDTHSKGRSLTNESSTRRMPDLSSLAWGSCAWIGATELVHPIHAAAHQRKHHGGHTHITHDDMGFRVFSSRWEIPAADIRTVQTARSNSTRHDRRKRQALPCDRLMLLAQRALPEWATFPVRANDLLYLAHPHEAPSPDTI